MSRILKPNEIRDFGKYLYNCLPEIYRSADREAGNLTLERFLETLNTQGYAHINRQIVGLIDLSHIENCKEEHLDLFANSLGCNWIHEVPMSYRRKLLSLIISLYKKKGTHTAIEYIARELSGFEVKIIEDEIPEEYWQEGDELKRLYTIKLLAPELDDPVQSKESEVTISKIIGHFVPVHSKYILVVTYFYDEPYFKQITEVIENLLKQDLGTSSKTFRGTQSVFDTIKFKYDQETKFDMIGYPDILGLTTNPKYKLVTSFNTTKTRYDILHHSKLVISNKEDKVFKGVGIKKEGISQNLGNYDKAVVVDTIAHAIEQKFTTLNESVFTMPQLDREEYELVNKITLNSGHDESINNHVETREVQKVQNNYNQDVNLDTKYNKTEKVMVKCILEDNPTTDLGINTCVLCTCKAKTVLSSKEGRLSIPSYIDKVYQNGQLNYIYE